MRLARSIVLPVLLVAVATTVAACGDDGESGASSDGSDGEVASDAEGYGSACREVGGDLAGEAAETIEVQLAEYGFGPATVEAPAGVVTFATKNVGSEAHELAFLPGGGDVPFTEAGEPDEQALGEMGAFELEAYPPGGSCDATYELEPGEYTLFCIVRAEDGETHYEKGMRGTLTVR